MRNTRIAIPFLLPSVVACQSIASSDVKTDGIYAALKATADSSPGTTIEARLKTGGGVSNTYLDLQGGDSLIAYFGSESKPMDRSSLLGEVWYTAAFPSVAENTLVRVDFERKHDAQTMQCLGGSAPNSMVTLPAPFTISGPMAGANASRKSDLTITWSPSGGMDPMTYSISGDCIVPISNQIAGDTGSLTISANTITTIANTAMLTCVITVNIQRARKGSVDSAFGQGGAFGATQTRQLTLNTTP
jgi:hypothetical protein